MLEYKIGDSILVEINGITKYGLFVNVDNNYTGLIHISEISGKYVKDVRKLYVIGEKIKAKVIGIDCDKKQLKLSIIGINENINRFKNLIEDESGFRPLKDNLSKWIAEKIANI